MCARYYPRGSNKPTGFSNRSAFKPVDAFDNGFSRWLYGDYDEGKLKTFEVLYSIPGIRNYMDMLLDYRADREYLNRYGMSWSDIHDPRKLHSVRSTSGMISFVSENVDKLYS